MTNNGDTTALLQSLVKRYGEERVLREPEDLYVYSHTREFGIERTAEPIAVLRLDPDELESLHLLLGENEVSVINTDELNSAPVDAPFLLVDSRNSLSIDELEKRIKELEEAEQGHRSILKERQSLSQWATAFVQSIDGYRLGERPDSNTGYCVVQRFFDGVETYSSKGRLILSRGLFSEEIAVSPRLIDSIYNCTACGQCYDQLSTGNLEINNAIIKTRNQIIRSGSAPRNCKQLLGNVLDEGNPMALPAEDRALWYEDTAEKFAFKHNKVIYWPGCTTSYRLPEAVEATAHILDTAEVDFGLLGENERCCGLILYLMGFWDEATRNADEMIRVLGAGNPETLVTSCAGCYYAFKRVYPYLGVQPGFNVFHTSQLYENLLKEGKLSFKEMKGDYVWHDPCDLGRHCHVYEPPRNVLGAIPGLNLVEPSLTRQHTICCGAGGGLWMYNEDLTVKVSHQKIYETFPSGVDGVITGCPTCVLNMRNAARETRPSFKVFDLSEFLLGKVQ
ncbi:MAG: (Fe-S)-binding protein [Candidatus Bathyarchaeota archaeon]|nr:(Fe-S)-binding protein [Candidatus Bathyarchaeota archaeon]